MTVLVAAASKHGATQEIAERIATELANRGVAVDVKNLEDAEDLRGYEASRPGRGARSRRSPARGSTAGRRSSCRRRRSRRGG
jgi:Flavodoxin domain